MASRGQKLDLQDCLLDTPKVHSQVAHFEAGLVPFREYVTLLRDTFQACHLHQEKVGEGARAISNLLVNIDSELGERAGSTSSSVFSQLSRYQTELYSCQEMFNSQLQNSVVHRMSALLEEDIDHLLALKDTYDNSRQEHEHAMAKFSRTSKRRDSDKARFEANAELYAARKKFYQCTLDYISQLKEFQMRRRFMLLEPVLTFMHAQMGYFKACQEIMNSGFQQLLTNLNGDIQSYHSEHENEVRELQQQKTELELQFPTLCVPDPDLSDPFTEFPTPNTGLSSRYGYLYLRVQKGGLAAKWERTFFFTKNGYLYTQSLQKNAEALLQLKEADAFASDCDDKRYVMQISHPALKKPVFLQAESDTQRTEWISVIRNNSVRKSQHGESLGNQTHDGARLRTRLYDSLERERIRSWASKELNQEPGSSRAAPSLPPSSVKPSSLGGGLKGATPPQRRPKSPLRSQKTATSSQQTNPETNSRATKSPQRSFSLLGLGSGNSGEKKSPSPRPPSLSSSKMAEVQNWVHSTNAATAMAQSLNHSPPSGELVVKFPVKYLGQKEVVEPKNPSTISGTIRGVITARAVKKVKPATSIELAIQLKKITLIETQSNKAIGKFLLKDIINCAVHPEDEKLFGVVCRVVEPERVKYVCHVMQADQSGSKVAGAISEAIQKLWRMMQGREGGGQRSGTDKKQIPPARPPPPVAPYTGSFLTSYTPAPSALSSSSHHHRTHTSPGALSSTLATPAFPTQHRSSSDSNLSDMAPPPQPGSGSGPGEEVGVVGSWAMGTISLLPPSLPDSSSTSAESLNLGRHEGDSQQPPFITEDSPLMFADILEENEDLPLILFDHSVLGGFGTPAPDPSPLPDGYVTDGGGGGGGGNTDFGSSSTATMQVPTETTTTVVLSEGGGGSGYVSTPPHPSSTSPSPTPPTVTSSQLSLPPRHPSSRPSHSPSPPAPTLPLTTTATVTSVLNNTASSSSKKNPTPVAAKSSSTAKQVKTTDSETGQTAPTTTTVSAADSLAQALGFAPPPSTTENERTTGEGGNATDPFAEAFGFDTTPEDIENLIQLMAPDSDPQLEGGVADNGYMTSNPLHTETYDDFGNF